jgi:type I restriction enzyme R subunit
LWDLFTQVKNKQDPAALRQALAPKIADVKGEFIDTNLKQREDFYALLTEFSNCMKVALQSASYFHDKSFDNKRDHYKQTLKMFVGLRQQVREDANESIDYDEYAEDIKNLLDKPMGGLEVK